MRITHADVNQGKMMNKPVLKPIKSNQQGVVIIEALVAILIFSMGVLAVVGLQAAMIKNTTDSKFRGDASYIAQQRVALIWTDSANIATYAEVATDISTTLPSGTRTTTITGTSQVVVTVTWQQPGKDVHNFTTAANINGG